MSSIFGTIDADSSCAISAIAGVLHASFTHQVITGIAFDTLVFRIGMADIVRGFDTAKASANIFIAVTERINVMELVA